VKRLGEDGQKPPFDCWRKCHKRNITALTVLGDGTVLSSGCDSEGSSTTKEEDVGNYPVIKRWTADGKLMTTFEGHERKVLDLVQIDEERFFSYDEVETKVWRLQPLLQNSHQKKEEKTMLAKMKRMANKNKSNKGTCLRSIETRSKCIISCKDRKRNNINSDQVDDRGRRIIVAGGIGALHVWCFDDNDAEKDDGQGSVKTKTSKQTLTILSFPPSAIHSEDTTSVEKEISALCEIADGDGDDGGAMVAFGIGRALCMIDRVDQPVVTIISDDTCVNSHFSTITCIVEVKLFCDEKRSSSSSSSSSTPVLASGSKDCTIKLWNRRTRQCIRTMFAGKARVEKLMVLRHTPQALGCLASRRLTFWNLKAECSGHIVWNHAYSCKKKSYNCPIRTQDCAVSVAEMDDGSIAFGAVNNIEFFRRPEPIEDGVVQDVEDNHSPFNHPHEDLRVRNILVLSPDGTILTLFVWKKMDSDEDYDDPSNFSFCIIHRFSPEGELLQSYRTRDDRNETPLFMFQVNEASFGVAYYQSNFVKLWSMNPSSVVARSPINCIRKIILPSTPFLKLRWRNTLLCVCGVKPSDRTGACESFQLWSCDEEKCIGELREEPNQSCAWRACEIRNAKSDKNLLVVHSRKGLLVWDLDSLQCVHSILEGSFHLWCLGNVGENGVVAYGQEKSLKFWDANKWETVQSLPKRIAPRKGFTGNDEILQLWSLEVSGLPSRFDRQISTGARLRDGSVLVGFHSGPLVLLPLSIQLRFYDNNDNNDNDDNDDDDDDDDDVLMYCYRY